MRMIDADALKELFSEVIGHIAKKPEMNGNLEHMIRASAMVIQMIDDAPTVQPNTTTHDPIPVKKGGNDGDKTSGDCVSRQAAIDMIKEIYVWHDSVTKERIIGHFKQLPSAQPEPRTAYWTKDIVGSVVCSNCGGIREDNRIGHTQWCNCCGCFMRGE